MATPEKLYHRRIAVAFCLLYVVVVPLALALKFTSSLFDAAAWPELVYGPAITLMCFFLLIRGAMWIECRFRKFD